MSTRHVLFGCIAALTAACSSSPPAQIGADDQFRVRYPDLNGARDAKGKAIVLDAQFVREPFPGLPLHDGGYAGDDVVLAAPTAPAGIPVRAGQVGEVIKGLADKRAQAVAFSLEGVSTGYWVVPVGGLDNSDLNDPRLSWTAYWDFGTGIAPGEHNIRVTSVGANGNIGGTTNAPQCIIGDVPSLYLCEHHYDPDNKPPAAIISLTWDVGADLDLQVKTPEGRLVDAKHPATDVTDAGVVLPGSGLIDRDSNSNCAGDVQTENLVFQDEKPQGGYEIYVNLFDSCKQPSVRFKVSVYETTENPDGGFGTLHEVWSEGGELLDFQANPSPGARGLYVNQFVFR